MHRTSAASKPSSVSVGDETASGTAHIGDAFHSSLREASLPSSNDGRFRPKDIHQWHYRTLEVLDLTETDVTETTATFRSDEIVEQASCMLSPLYPQLLIEDMINRLKEVNDSSYLELPITQPAIATERSVHRLTIAEMTVRLRRVNDSDNNWIQHAPLDLMQASERWEHCSSNSLSLRRPRRRRTAKSTIVDHSKECSFRNDQINSSLCAVADHSSQIPLSDLIDRLHRVNKEITSEPKLHVALQRKSKISITNSEEDLAQILHQVNCRCVYAERADELNVQITKPPLTASRSVDRQSHQSSLEYLSSTNSWIEEECGTATSADYIAFAAQDIGSHADHGDDISGCTLHASSRSCSSSVTWYEGSDIDEVPFDENGLSATLSFEGVDEFSFST